MTRIRIPRPQAAAQTTTALPPPLRKRVESASGMDLSQVRVHPGSALPFRAGALATTSGNDIHLAPGQERHLAHEAWHVVQQRQGRVPATTQYAGMAVNDSAALEKEADAFARGATPAVRHGESGEPQATVAQCRVMDEGKLALIRDYTREYMTRVLGGRRLDDRAEGRLVKIQHALAANYDDEEITEAFIRQYVDEHLGARAPVAPPPLAPAPVPRYGAMPAFVPNQPPAFDAADYLRQLAAMDEERRREPAPLPTRVRATDRRRPPRTFTSNDITRNSNQECVLAAFASATGHVNAEYLNRMTATEEGMAGVASSEGMHEGTTDELIPVLQAGGRAVITAPALYGAGYHAYCAFGWDEQTQCVLAWDPDNEHADVKAVPRDLIYKVFLR